MPGQWWKAPDWRETDPSIQEGKSYSNRELELKADALLRADAATETCPSCGSTELDPKADAPTCPDGHTWDRLVSRRRGINGKDPILFEEHVQSRRRREIYNANGVPDP